jgi:hypothetical protein
MLHRNRRRKPSNSNPLLWLKYHAPVAELHLCDGLESWFISGGRVLSGDPAKLMSDNAAGGKHRYI